MQNIKLVYEPDFGFLRGGTCTIYKYIPDIQKFVPGPNAMYDGYDRNFMDIENLHLADGEVNGTYAVVTQPLPAELVISTEEIQPLRDQLEQAEIQTPQTTENAEKQDDNNVVTVSDKDESVKWSFANDVIPENFTSEAKIEITSDKGIKVDFAYSGKLPDGTKVTITLPSDAAEYKDGKTFYFYYYNPDTKGYEYVSKGIAQNGEVTFDIEHCSEYLITPEKLVEVEIIAKEPDLLSIIVAGIVLLVGASVVTYIIIKKIT